MQKLAQMYSVDPFLVMWMFLPAAVLGLGGLAGYLLARNAREGQRRQAALLSGALMEIVYFAVMLYREFHKWAAVVIMVVVGGVVCLPWLWLIRRGPGAFTEAVRSPGSRRTILILLSALVVAGIALVIWETRAWLM